MDSHVIYLDNNSTTRTDDRVVEAMIPFFTDFYGNPSSNHAFGNEINRNIKQARIKVADLLNSNDDEIVFTSCGTESINLAIKGYALLNKINREQIITTQIEHKAVLETCNYLESLGFDVKYIPVNPNGICDLNEIKKAISRRTILVCVMHTNNETGVVQPISEIAEISHYYGAKLMCDATQSVGKIETNVNELQADFMSFSGHKFYGPKGIGGLYIRNKQKIKNKIEPIIHGGGQEFKLRSGTLNVPAIIGLGYACEIAKQEMGEVANKVKTLRDKLENGLLVIKGAYLIGDKIHRLYNTSNICFPGEDANILIGRMKNIAVSTGAACSSAIFEPSHVLKAMGLNHNDAMASLRFSLGKYNTEAEIEETIYMMHRMLNH